jgi:riboflavin synthase
MFSGIVEEMGTVEALVTNPTVKLWDGSVGEGVELTVSGVKAVQEAYIGCSIAVNGVCLTATALPSDVGNKPTFTVNLAPETLRRTNLGFLKSGDLVNLERALKADSRNSGHFVQGHVDCTGEIIDKWKDGDSLWVKVSVPDEYIKYIVPKGFVAVDGTSLTICEVHTGDELHVNWFTFMLISHTQQAVIVPKKSIGDLLNIEVDVLAKMVEQSTAASQGRLERRILALEAKLEKLEMIENE